MQGRYPGGKGAQEDDNQLGVKGATSKEKFSVTEIG